MDAAREVKTTDLGIALELATPHQRQTLQTIAKIIGPGEDLEFRWPDGTEGDLELVRGGNGTIIAAGPATLPAPGAAAPADGEPARFERVPCDECGEALPMHAAECSRRPTVPDAPRAIAEPIERAYDGEAEGGVEAVQA